jgi:hypothetical protein
MRANIPSVIHIVKEISEAVRKRICLAEYVVSII